LDRPRGPRETLGPELERRRRPRRRFVEHVDHEPAFGRRQLLHLALERALEGPRGREQPLEVVAWDVRYRDEVPLRWRRGRPQVLPHDLDLPHYCVASSGDGTSRIRSTSSISTSCTWMRSSREVGRFLPT